MAYGKHATQGVDTYNNHVAARAVDGNHDWDLNHNHCVHTIDNSSPRDPSWWEVDLGETYVVLAVNITNRFDCGGRCTCEFSYIHLHIYCNMLLLLAPISDVHVSPVLTLQPTLICVDSQCEGVV